MTTRRSDSPSPAARRLRALYIVHKTPVGLAGGWSLWTVANLAGLAKVAEVNVVAIRQWAGQDDAPVWDASARSLVSRYCSDLKFVDPLTPASPRNLLRRIVQDGFLMNAARPHPEITRLVTYEPEAYDFICLRNIHRTVRGPDWRQDPYFAGHAQRRVPARARIFDPDPATTRLRAQRAEVVQHSTHREPILTVR